MAGQTLTEEDRPIGDDPLNRLYPFVDETKTPLPRGWSSRDKWTSIGVSQTNLRVTYRGQGKTHKDAAAVRASHPIPPTCGLYYFEVKIVSKGRDGYMGIGLCQKDVSLNRLPGWDRFSYGYHGDDGNFFCSSGSGVPYGPTFTTGDVIGCGLNLVDNTCFYTKNGQNLGIAFQDLPGELFPTVGLQTPGEIVDTNFGQEPFVYNLADDLAEAQLRTRTAILQYPLPAAKTEWLSKLISSYLVHHGFCATAESFNEATEQQMNEEITSMKNRQRIQSLVLSGRISDAIQMVNQLYPGLLDRNAQLFFLLKCRQFVEMVAGVDSVDPLRRSGRSSPAESPCSTPPHKSSAPYVKVRPSPIGSPRDSPRYSPRRLKSPRSHASPLLTHSSDEPECSTAADDNTATNGVASVQNGCAPSFSVIEEQMDVCIENGSSVRNGNTVEQTTDEGPRPDSDDATTPEDEAMDSEDCSSGSSRVIGIGNAERLIEFGRQLMKLSKDLKPQNRTLKKKMDEVFSLMAYPDPSTSPQGRLLQPSQRQPVATALNSAILEYLGHPSRPALEVVFCHGERLRQEMASASIGAATFADPQLLFATQEEGTA